MSVPPPPPLPRPHRDGTRTWQSRTVQQQIEWLRTAMGELDKRALEIIPRVCADRYAGSPGGGGRVADDGSVPGPTPLAVVRGDLVDPVRVAGARFFGGLVAARAAVEGMVAAAEQLLALAPDEARDLLDMLGRGGRLAGHCVNCSRWVPGTGNDRLRAFRCGACWRWRLRHEGEERPRVRWDDGDGGGDDDG